MSVAMSTGIAPSMTDGLFDDDLPKQPVTYPEFSLSIYHPAKPCSYVLRGDAYAVGRDQTNAIRVVNRYVSRRHAYLVRVPNKLSRSGFTYCLIDGNRKGQSSTNGVFVNGTRIATHYLKSGDVIYFGPEIKAYFFEIAPIPSVPNPFNTAFPLKEVD
ncbi:MAG: FHA domain-containing protein [Cyanobacteriota bacterium]|nr:FHA domain-containing protein [Cyanobacteriota bacterium]